MSCPLSDLELSEWVGREIMDEHVPQSHYTHDLNACAKAELKIRELPDYNAPVEIGGEMVLCGFQPWQSYWDALVAVIKPSYIGCEGELKDDDRADVATTTARKRTEAMWLIREQIEAAKAGGKA